MTSREIFVRRWCIAAISVITVWTLWTLLDAFVIPRDIVLAEENADTDGTSTGDAVADAGSDYLYPEEEEPVEELTEPVITDTSYRDGDISIEISYMRTLDTNIYIADIEINDPSYLNTALAEGSFGRNLTDTTSSIATQNDAILAINGDYYGFRDSGYVMRNGYLYRTEPAKDPEQEDLVIFEDGSIDILREADISAEAIKGMGATDIFSFGPGLVMNGEITVDSDDEVERAQVTNPRTAMGIISPLHFLFVVSDGRTDESIGLSLFELAQLMQKMNCVTAYNLDGGGSSTMWFNGKVLNRPTTFGETIVERKVSDIVYIGK